ncbi:MAG: LPP20 family lipoprotein [Rickettsiales bacterium]|jgi:hypothetical protein|nr:LPP20 family lipoprotein [Rickettsiales bacterium]
MKKIPIVFILLLSNVFADVPDWVSDKGKECSNSEVCAIGTGDTLNEAKRDARANILKYFEANINTNFKNEITESGDDVKTKSSFNIGENAEGILNGVDIKKTYNEKKTSYALAVLDKTKISNILKNDIEKLDTKIELLLEEKGAINYPQLEILYKRRESLNKQYMFLNDKGIPEKVKYAQIFKTKNNIGKLGYYLKIEGKSSNGLKNVLKSIIVQAGGKIVSNLNAAERVIIGEVKEREQYIKVDGFVKYIVEYSLESKTKDGVSQSVLTQEYEEIGRNFNHILSKTDEKFKDYLKNDYFELLK